MALGGAGFVLLALAAAALAVMTPDAARWAGVMLLAGIGAVASIFLYAVWPKESFGTADARRVAEAAARANVAWAITGADGAVLDCNDVYRRMAGAAEGEAAPPPELALAGEPSAGVLYRLTRSAAEATAREESFQVAPGLEIVAAVRPLSGRQTAWWFTPRLAASRPVGASGRRGTCRASRRSRDRRCFSRRADGDGIRRCEWKSRRANRAFATFFDAQAALAGRNFPELVELRRSDRRRVN